MKEDNCFIVHEILNSNYALVIIIFIFVGFLVYTFKDGICQLIARAQNTPKDESTPNSFVDGMLKKILEQAGSEFARESKRSIARKENANLARPGSIPPCRVSDIRVTIFIPVVGKEKETDLLPYCRTGNYEHGRIQDFTVNHVLPNGADNVNHGVVGQAFLLNSDVAATNLPILYPHKSQRSQTAEIEKYAKETFVSVKYVKDKYMPSKRTKDESRRIPQSIYAMPINLNQTETSGILVIDTTHSEPMSKLEFCDFYLRYGIILEEAMRHV